MNIHARAECKVWCKNAVLYVLASDIWWLSARWFMDNSHDLTQSSVDIHQLTEPCRCFSGGTLNLHYYGARTRMLTRTRAHKHTHTHTHTHTNRRSLAHTHAPICVHTSSQASGRCAALLYPWLIINCKSWMRLESNSDNN